MDRISIKGDLGTVKWIGELPGKEGTWFGIEWDDPARGKHGGELEGTSYFTTRHPTSGSFLK